MRGSLTFTLVVICFSSLSTAKSFDQYTSPFHANNTSIQIERVLGIKRVKTAMPGILYWGGNAGGGTIPLKSSAVNTLCNNGFSKAIYVYSSDKAKSVNCGQNSLEYKNIHYLSLKKKERKMKEFFRDVYEVINSNGQLGPVYLHCWNGYHASNFAASMALIQFCDWSAHSAYEHWVSHSNGYKNTREKSLIQRKMRELAAARHPEFTLTNQQRDRFCHR